MPKRFTNQLSECQCQELLFQQNRATKPYLRERAAALLKINSGQPISFVAKHGLLRPRSRQTLSDWWHRYQLEGLDGLLIRAGRGRPAAFSPSPRLS